MSSTFYLRLADAVRRKDGIVQKFRARHPNTHLLFSFLMGNGNCRLIQFPFEEFMSLAHFEAFKEYCLAMQSVVIHDRPGKLPNRYVMIVPYVLYSGMCKRRSTSRMILK